MKRILFLLALLVILAGAAWAASPQRSIAAMKQAVDDGDSERLDRYIDYPALRENLKLQLRSGIGSYLQGDGQEDNPFAALGSVLAGRLGDDLVDSWVTPEGVADLMRGQARPAAPGDDGPRAGDPGGETEDDRLLRDARLRFRSFSEVEVTARDDRDRDLVFVLVRHGLIWKLTDVVLPLQAER